MSALRFCLRAAGFGLILAAALLIRFLAPALRKDGIRCARLLWCRGCLALLNVRTGLHGRPAPGGPTLFVANHVSWLDILVLGGVVDGAFVAKAEVAGWPLFGSLARLAGTIFIERHWRRARQQCRQLRERLGRGDDLILFPEGTSTDGRAVLPFKSSLFAAAVPAPGGATAQVQPVTIAYLPLAGEAGADDGRATGRHAWHGEQLFLPHLCQVLADRGCRVELVFHPSMEVADLRDRKAVAARARQVVAETLAGRLREPQGGREAAILPPRTGEPAWRWPIRRTGWRGSGAGR